MKRTSLFNLLLVLGLVLALSGAFTALTDAATTATAAITEGEYTDDFSSETGLWTYWGTAYRDEENGCVVLATTQTPQYGIIWLNDEFTGPFTAQFRYLGAGTDGLVFMFNKNKDYQPGTGGYLGFVDEDTHQAAGYGIEFDGWLNWTDSSYNHVALIKDSVDNHLAYVDNMCTSDNEWHEVQVAVGIDSVTVEVDGEQLITWRGDIDRSFSSVGFTAVYGGGGHLHMIDDVTISIARGVLISPSSQTETGVADTSKVYDLTVSNLTGAADSFTLSVSDNAWPTSLLIDSTGMIAGGDSVSFAAEVGIPASASPGDTDTVTITATSVTDPAMTVTATLTTTAILAEGLVAYHPFNGNANDESGLNHHGTVHGATLATDRFGNPNSAYSFDGSNDYIQIADSDDVDFGTGSFTVSAWIKTDATTGIGSGRDEIIDKGHPTASGIAISMRNNRAAFWLGGGWWIESTTVLNDGQWHHIIGTRDDSGNVALYVDGVIEITGTNTTNVNTDNSIIIGRHGEGNESYFDGLIDDVSIFNEEAIPQAGFSATPASGVVPLTVQFTDTSSGYISDWQWDFDGDGTVDSTEQNPSYTYTNIGDYTVSLTVTGLGLSDEETTADCVRVYEVPQADFAASPTAGSAPLNVEFADQSTGNITGCEWDFDGDGTVDSTEQSPSHSYISAGVYSISLTTSNPAGTDTETRTDFITVNPGPLDHIIVTPSSAAVTVDQTQQFSATAYDEYDNEIPEPTFTWSVDASAGEIDSSGLFTAGTEAGTSAYTVSCQAEQEGVVKSGSATVSVKLEILGQQTVSPTSEANLVTEDQRIAIHFPAGAVSTETTVTVSQEDVDDIPSLPTGFKLGGTYFSIEGVDTLDKAITITVKYSDDDVSAAGGDPDLLSLARYDESAGRWVVLPTTVDTTARTLTVTTDELSLWAVLSEEPPLWSQLKKWLWLMVVGGIAVVGITLLFSRSLYLGLEWRRWEREGFSLSDEGEKLSRKELRARIGRLREAEKGLRELNPPSEEFGVDVGAIRAGLKSPSRVDDVERRLEVLRPKVREYRSSLRATAAAPERARGAVETARAAPVLEPGAKSPWNPGVFYALALLFGFGSAGILAGINYRRLGKPQLAWPTAIVSVLTFVAMVVALGFVLEIEPKTSWVAAVNIPPAFLLARLQRSDYKEWKERFPSARGGGWGIPIATCLASLAVVGIVIVGAAFLAPDEAAKQYDRGVDLQEDGRYSQAIEAYDEAIRLDPKLSEAYHNRALCHAVLGHYSDAVYDASRAIDLNPRSALTYAVRGLTYADMGQTSKAIADLEKALELGGLTQSQKADVELTLWELRAGG